MPHVRVIRRPGMHGRWVPLDEFTVPLPVSLALRFIHLRALTSTSSITTTTVGAAETHNGACNVGFNNTAWIDPDSARCRGRHAWRASCRGLVRPDRTFHLGLVAEPDAFSATHIKTLAKPVNHALERSCTPSWKTAAVISSQKPHSAIVSAS